MEFFKNNWWKSNYKLPVSFIIFFVLAFFLIGEQLPALQTYLAGPSVSEGNSGKLHILDLSPSDALHRPAVYVLIGAITFVLFRKLAWPIAWALGGTIAVLDQFFLTPLDHRPEVSILSALIILFAWGVFALVPYFIYRTVDYKWGEKGRRNAILILVAINILLLSFFAYQIYVAHNSHRYNSQGGLANDNQSFSDKNSPVNAETYSNLSIIVPYANEQDVSSVNEAFSTTEKSPWGFRHVGIDFMSTTDLIPIQAVADGTIEKLSSSKENEQQGWHTGLCINHNPLLVCYNFETFSPDSTIGQKQGANILVKNGGKVKQGDLIGRLVHGGSGAHLDFGVLQTGGSGERICPEPYFTEDAKASILRLIHKDHPTWAICYE